MKEITEGMLERYSATFVAIRPGKSLRLTGGRRQQLKQMIDAMGTIKNRHGRRLRRVKP